SKATTEAPKGRCSGAAIEMSCFMTSIYLELRPNLAAPPFQGFLQSGLEPRACALGCPAGPLRGPWFRARNYLVPLGPLGGHKPHKSVKFSVLAGAGPEVSAFRF